MKGPVCSVLLCFPLDQRACLAKGALSEIQWFYLVGGQGRLLLTEKSLQTCIFPNFCLLASNLLYYDHILVLISTI